MSHNNKAAKDAEREARIVAAVPCSVCGAAIGQPCREGTSPHDGRRGGEDRRPVLRRTHNERRADWVASKAQ